jgi:hypothetical protein
MFVACGPTPSKNTIAQGASIQPHVATAISRPSVSGLPPELPVAFSHLPPGTYTVHLHSICSGRQAFHLAYLPDLVVGPDHTGQVLVPTTDFGRGDCVIVYADPVLSIVLVTQHI